MLTCHSLRHASEYVDRSIHVACLLLLDIDDCNDQPCVNGSCIDAINTYSCLCGSGFTGYNCSTGTLLTKYSIPVVKLNHLTLKYFMLQSLR